MYRWLAVMWFRWFPVMSEVQMGGRKWKTMTVNNGKRVCKYVGWACTQQASNKNSKIYWLWLAQTEEKWFLLHLVWLAWYGGNWYHQLPRPQDLLLLPAKWRCTRVWRLIIILCVALSTTLDPKQHWMNAFLLMISCPVCIAVSTLMYMNVPLVAGYKWAV